MSKRFAATLLCVLVFCAAAAGQSSGSSDFGTVPDSLFAPGQYPTHPNVPFIYSLKKLHITFAEDGTSIIAELHYQVRVKIFDSSARQAALVGIPYYFKNGIEDIENIRGFTYQSLDKKVPLNPGKIRTININSRYNVKEFTMPAVKDGSVIEYAYTIRRRYLEELPDFYLANQVPTKRAEVSITYPQYLRYQGILQNYEGHLNHFISRVDTSMVPKVFVYPQPAPIVTETWRAVDVPAVKKEAYISTLDDYRGKIKFQMSEFGIPRQPLENSWNYVVAEIRRKQHINATIDANIFAREQGKEIARRFDDARAVQDSIFHYVAQKVKYSGSSTPFSSVSSKVVLQGKPVDQAAINQTLAAMLRGAGIEAWPMLVSSRKSGQINRSFPSFFQFNGQLVYSKIKGRSYFMDASYPYSRPNLIPVDMYNQTGLLIKPDHYRWVDMQPKESLFSIQVNISAKLDRQGDLSGTLKAQNTGYSARDISKQNAAGVSNGQIIEKALLNGYTDVEINRTQLHSSHGDKAVDFSADFSIKNYARSFRDGLDFRPLIVGYLRQNPFDSNSRNLPVTLDAPQHLNLSFAIHLPQGISMSRPPQNNIIRLPGAKLAEHYQMEAHTLHYTLQIDISQKQFSPDLYPRLLDLYKRWVQLSNDVWHLKR